MVTLTDELKALYPWTPRTLDLSTHHSMSYLDEGAGKPVLMVHGNPTWSFYYRRLVAEFRDEFRMIAPDHIGAGLSDKPTDYPYQLQNHIDNLAELIEELDLQDYTLVVHDWGGATGLGAALKAPERVGKLVIFNTAVSSLGAAPLSIKLCRTALGPMLIQGLNAFIRVGLFWSTTRRDRFKGLVAKGFLAPYPTWESRLGQLRFIQDIPFEPDHPSFEALKRVTDGVKVFADRPTKIIWGERDFVFTPAYRKDFMARFPNAEVHPFDDAGHWVVEDAHERVIPLLRDLLQR